MLPENARLITTAAAAFKTTSGVSFNFGDTSSNVAQYSFVFDV